MTGHGVRLTSGVSCGATAASDPSRFRIRLLDAEVPVRTIEVNAPTATCSAASLGLDFPNGLNDAEAAVAQWSDGYGWGVEARIRLG